jgi:prepilin-type N-terminal cleavage/methylation domain-containing protein
METTRNTQHPISSIQHPRGFTLVELLVVITIIGILTGLITVAAVGAMKAAQRTRIKVEIDQMSTAVEEYKNKNGSYPPNTVTDFGPDETLTNDQRLLILTDLKRHMKQAFPRHRESDDLLARLAGLASSGQQLAGGMTAGEAIVFWLSGASADPKYPISGEGGPSYPIPGLNQSQNRELDPLESRNWVFPFEVARLGTRKADGFFDDSTGRYIEYTITIPGQNNNQPQTRRINFWQYTPTKSEQPYLYFDTSRHTPDVLDPPARNDLHVHALKQIQNPGSTSERVLFATPDKFQVLHCGIDNAWGEDLDRTSYSHYLNERDKFLAYPAGPFTGEVADTIVNFSEGALEDSQP